MSDHLDGVQLSRLIDGDLSLASRDAARAHLRHCSRCAQKHDELIAVAASLRLLPRMEWSAIQTERVAAQVSGHRRPRLVAWTLVACVGVCVAGLVAASPAIVVGLAVGHTITAVVATVSPAPVLAAAPELVVIIAVAILAPLFAYPLARWR